MPVGVCGDRQLLLQETNTNKKKRQKNMKSYTHTKTQSELNISSNSSMQRPRQPDQKKKFNLPFALYEGEFTFRRYSISWVLLTSKNVSIETNSGNISTSTASHPILTNTRFQRSRIKARPSSINSSNSVCSEIVLM